MSDVAVIVIDCVVLPVGSKVRDGDDIPRGYADPGRERVTVIGDMGLRGSVTTKVWESLTYIEVKYPTRERERRA